MDNFSEQDFIQMLMEVRDRDYDKFMELVLTSLKTYPDFAVEDDAPIENKLTAMKVILNHLEEKEDYEDCVFILDLQKKIEDAKKG